MATGRVRAEAAANEGLIAVLQRSLAKPDGDLYEQLLQSFEEPLNRDSAESAADTAAGLFMRAIRRWQFEQAPMGEQMDDVADDLGKEGVNTLIGCIICDDDDYHNDPDN